MEGNEKVNIKYFKLHCMKRILLLIYYMFLQRIPMQPMPGYHVGYKLRYMVVRRLLRKCGKDVIVKDHCYFGNGVRLTVGDRSQMGSHARFNGDITIGNDVLMGPDVVMMATSHEFSCLNVPINQQGSKQEEPIVIGNDCWIGTRVIILPGVTYWKPMYSSCRSSCNAFFSRQKYIGGVPARLLKTRE